MSKHPVNWSLLKKFRLTRTVYLPILRPDEKFSITGLDDIVFFDRQWLHLRADRAWCQRGSGQSPSRLLLAEPDTRSTLGGADGRIVPAQRSQR